ncbi:MAG: Dabb family protein [Chloroflexi bacterium]|nr:Dabb family protein [Chloroflexota bacterium]
MIKHIVLLKFKDGAPQEAVDDFLNHLRSLPSKIPTIRNPILGKAIPQTMSGFTHSWICEFDDAATWQAYMDNPDHRAGGAKFVPIRGDSVVAVFEY